MLADQESRRPPHLRDSENEEVLDHRLGNFKERTRGAGSSREHHAFLHERFSFL